VKSLVTGAFTLVNSISRRGKICAAVALVNKMLRTAFSMLIINTEYRAMSL